MCCRKHRLFPACFQAKNPPSTESELLLLLRSSVQVKNEEVKQQLRSLWCCVWFSVRFRDFHKKNASSLLLPWTNWESEREMLLKFSRNRTHSSENIQPQGGKMNDLQPRQIQISTGPANATTSVKSVSRLTRQMRQNIWQILFPAAAAERHSVKKWKGSSWQPTLMRVGRPGPKLKLSMMWWEASLSCFNNDNKRGYY